MPQPPKRSSNKRRIERRAASWARGQKRKRERRSDNEVSAALNREAVENGGTRPWDRAKAARFRLRHKRCHMGNACKLNPDYHHTAENAPLWRGRKA